jgi:hypothetical protein
MPNDVLNALKKAAKGLLYQSESDEPFEAFLWKDGGRPLTRARLLELTGHPADTPVEEVKPGQFFKDLTEEQDWYGDEEKATVERYKALWKTLKEHLANVRVFKVGEVNRDIYIVGKTPSGDWAGVKTAAVET